VHLDRGRLVHPQHPIVVEIGLLDPAILECDFTPQRAADAEIDATLDLAFTVSGLITVPQSTATTIRCTRSSPAFDTSTSATSAR